MIALSPGGRVYLACGITDLRKGAVGLAMLVQQSLLENPFDGSVYAFRGRRSGLIKVQQNFRSFSGTAPRPISMIACRSAGAW